MQLISWVILYHVWFMCLQKQTRKKKNMEKWDVKDGFWQMDCWEGEQYNFAYVLPQPPGVPMVLVIPLPLQMGWVKSPPFFCATTETSQDIAMQYSDIAVGSLQCHKFEKLLKGDESFWKICGLRRQTDTPISVRGLCWQFYVANNTKEMGTDDARHYGGHERNTWSFSHKWCWFKRSYLSQENAEKRKSTLHKENTPRVWLWWQSKNNLAWGQQER